MTKNERNSVKSLRSKENRLRENRMVVEGAKGVCELLNSSLVTERIYTTSGSENAELNKLASENNVEICKVSSKDMEIMSSLKNAPGVLAVGKPRLYDANQICELATKNINGNTPCLLMLDNLNDPGNVGTLIRTAHWFGFAGVICSPKTADVWNTKSIQASMGSVFNIPIAVADLAEIIVSNKLNCAILDAKGVDLYNSQAIPNAVIVGSESHGLSDDIRSLGQTIWAIPGNGGAESLNASIAGAIVCAEISRRLSTSQA
ncbi:MAG: hypothetical protein CMB32_04885 [Euryarchaeota archaeon]|nr:hypothetical protein [Euryarchaeota archaeon]|tara:strand:- start:1005 stop:1787 length:783 start_codon:yes stop_codon:yes gene_type:complete